MSVDGLVDRPTLNYSSYSSNIWSLNTRESGWNDYLLQNRKIVDGDFLTLKLLDPEILISGNTTSARQELLDGTLWQGRGVNFFSSIGLEMDIPYLSIRFYPEFWFAQNLAFETMTPNPSQPNTTLGYIFYGIDWPQRPGTSLYSSFDWGQSEIRFQWRMLTLGLSHENIQLGPARVNPLLISNNAPGFWHLDIGVNKTPTAIGDFEYRAFWGRLDESDFYDQDSSNDYSFFSGWAFAYGPSFIPGLSIGFNRTLSMDWRYLNIETFFQAIIPNFFNSKYGHDETDGKASLTIDWMFPSVGLELYGEIFMEDYSDSIYNMFLEPEHAKGFTGGLVKSFPIKNGRFLSTFEYTQMMQSRDYEQGLGVGGTYYTHHIVYHGHTHNGQVLGAGIGPGSDSQTILLDWYTDWGKLGWKIQRINWQKDFIYGYLDRAEANNYKFNVELLLGMNGTYLWKHWELSGELLYSVNFNRNYVKDNQLMNLYGNVSLKYRF